MVALIVAVQNLSKTCDLKDVKLFEKFPDFEFELEVLKNFYRYICTLILRF